MTIQRVIKNLAIAFGIFLSVTIISSIIFGVLMVGSIITGVNLYSSQKNLVEETIQITQDIDRLNIKLNVSRLNIEIGDEFKVETKGEKNSFNVGMKNHTLEIEEKSRNNFWGNNYSEVTIYIPEEIEFKEIRIDSGVGEANIQKLVTDKIIINLGVGSTTIKELVSREDTKVTGGVGKFEIQSGEINDLKLDSGVGKSTIKAMITR